MSCSRQNNKMYVDRELQETANESCLPRNGARIRVDLARWWALAITIIITMLCYLLPLPHRACACLQAHSQKMATYFLMSKVQTCFGRCHFMTFPSSVPYFSLKKCSLSIYISFLFFVFHIHVGDNYSLAHWYFVFYFLTGKLQVELFKHWGISPRTLRNG